MGDANSMGNHIESDASAKQAADDNIVMVSALMSFHYFLGRNISRAEGDRSISVPTVTCISGS